MLRGSTNNFRSRQPASKPNVPRTTITRSALFGAGRIQTSADGHLPITVTADRTTAVRGADLLAFLAYLVSDKRV